MINTSQQKAIKKYLGKHYSPKIIVRLSKRKIFNSKNEVFSCKSIQNIVNGKQENMQVEKEIFKLIAYKKKALAKENLLRKQVLKK
jgi:hypothetical protein